GDGRARVDQVGRAVGGAAGLAVVAVLVRRLALGAGALDVAVGQEHRLDRVVELLDRAALDAATRVQRGVEALGQGAVLVRMGRVVPVEVDPEVLEVALVAGLGRGDEGLGRDPRLLGGEHDRRAVGVVGADVVDGLPALAPRPHPDVGLDVADQVAQVQRAVGVGQGVGDQGGAGHGETGHGGPAIIARGRCRALRGLRRLEGSDPAWAGSLEGTRGRWGLLAFPDLRLADEGHAAGNLQLPAALDQLHLGLVDLALVRLEDGAAGALAAALGLHAADDLHPGDRLALAVVLALVAGRIRLGRIDQLDDATVQGAVGGLGDLHVRLGLAGFAVDGLPAADDRIGGRGHRGQGHQRHGDQAGQQGLAHVFLPWVGPPAKAGLVHLYQHPLAYG